MICPQCGSEINNGARFCISCGYKVPVTGDKNLEVRQTPRKNNSKYNCIIIILMVLLLIAIGTIVYLLFMQKAPSRSNDGAELVVWQKTTSDPQEIDSAVETTSEERNPDETVPDEITDQTGTAIVTSPETNEQVGIPIPDVPKEILDNVAGLYRQVISEDSSIVSYSLLDMIGDEVPELIVKYSMGERNSYYRIYFAIEGTVVVAGGDQITAGLNDTLLGIDGKLLICYDENVATQIELDTTLRAKSLPYLLDKEVAYTDTVFTALAQDLKLLDAVMFGHNRTPYYDGWIRSESKDYYYASGKPITNKWRCEGENLYYLGNSGYVTHMANQQILQTIADAYCEGVVKACNEQNLEFLQYATEHNKTLMRSKILTEANRSKNITAYKCTIKIADKNNNIGSISLQTRVEWSYTENDSPQQFVSVKYYYVMFTVQDGQLLVDKIVFS